MIHNNHLLIYSVLFRCWDVILAFEVTTTQFHFWFNDKVHKDWILDSYEDSHMVTCLQRCRSDSDCNGLALGPVQEGTEDYARTCHTLKGINEMDCDGGDDCKQEGFQVYHLSKPLTTTTTEIPPTTQASTTTTTEITSTTEKETTTEKVTTTTEFPTTTMTEEPTTIAKTSTSQPTTTLTETPTTTTTTEPTTTKEPTTTTEATTTTTTKATTTTTTEPTTTTTAKPTTTTTTESTTTTTAKPTTTTAEPTTTTTTEPTTTTAKPTTTTTKPTTTTTKPTTTTSKPTTTTTTQSAITTTSEPITTTTAKPITTTEVLTTTSKATTTTTTAPSSCSGPFGSSEFTGCDSQKYEGGCQGQSKSITCSGGYRENKLVFGLTANAPLFTDITMDVKCKDVYNQAIFEMDIPKTAYKPFSGVLGCDKGQTITGIDVCFEGDLKYVAIECNTLNPNFKLEGSTEKSGNSKQDPSNAGCPGDKAMASLQLSKDNEGNIQVAINCDKIIKN
ncbi:uncharacterized protein NPIL_375371 [Nephila pilipes]|uniref:Apple domain-containing protein n=1 Tax=Nephila pilipes TaxID=299642 RepID=A0A8X6T6L2_NEPPI|nr:uncharacterized protein NPIL_375371 [Nephila pilipes]